MNSAIKERLDTYVASKGLRQTKQRNDMVEEIFTEDEHFTAEELIDRLKTKGVKTSRATVYRTIRLLVDAGLLVEIELGDGVTTYDPNFVNNPAHNHLVCVDCGKVSEFEDPHLDMLNDCISTRMGFRAVKKSLMIEACCERLRASGTCPSLIQARITGKRMPNSSKR